MVSVDPGGPGVPDGETTSSWTEVRVREPRSRDGTRQRQPSEPGSTGQSDRDTAQRGRGRRHSARQPCGEGQVLLLPSSRLAPQRSGMPGPGEATGMAPAASWKCSDLCQRGMQFATAQGASELLSSCPFHVEMKVAILIASS